MIIRVFSTFLSNASYRYLLYATIGVLLSGVVGYRLLEHWRWIDCLNYAVSTMVTTGNAGVLPKSDAGKLFNVIYMFVSVMLILFFISTVQQHFKELLDSSKVRKKRRHKIAKQATDQNLGDR